MGCEVGEIVSISGHRPQKLGGFVKPNPVEAAVKGALATWLRLIRPSRVVVGMALGVDQWAAEVSLELGIPFTAALPFKGQESQWPEESQRLYHELLSKASEVVVVCEGGYAAWKLQKRNEYMVDHSDLLLAIWDGSTGGTANCLTYARKVGRTMVIANPRKIT